MRKFFVTTAAALGIAVAAGGAVAAEGGALTDSEWGWEGIFGTYDKAQLKRGFQVYKDVCSNCHSLNLVAYRNLAEIGFGEDQIKAFAAEKQVTDGPNDDGEMFQRPALPSDQFVAPFPNDKAARVANNGALPPDLSLMTKARKGGPDYVYSLLMGYQDPPADFQLGEGMSYNTVFPGHQIAMPPQIFDDLVAYEDGAPTTAADIAKDVTAFLNWAAEPELEARKNMGLKTMIFLGFLTAMMYALKRSIWRDVH